MPLIKGKTDESRSKNIGTEMRAGKPMDQAAAIAYSIQRKAKAKKMAQGGWVEETPVEKLHNSHSGIEHYKEEEPVQSKETGKGFTQANVGQAGEKFVEHPEMFNKGGMCYAEGGEVGPMMMLLRKRALEKLAYGGLINEKHGLLDEEDEAMNEKLSEDGSMGAAQYPPFLEQDEQTEAMQEGTQAPAHTEAPEKDEDRVAFLRSMAMKRAMRR
jgi:hypothetical protein